MRLSDRHAAESRTIIGAGALVAAVVFLARLHAELSPTGTTTASDRRRRGLQRSGLLMFDGQKVWMVKGVQGRVAFVAEGISREVKA